MMSNTLLESVVKKNRARLIPFMLALYVLAFLDRSNIGFAKETYQLDTGLSNEAYALGAGDLLCGLCLPRGAGQSADAQIWRQAMDRLHHAGCGACCRRRWRGRIRKSKFLLVRTCWAAAEAASFPE